MHFASTGVLLLRKLGVPARYVSGYKVDASEFKLDTSQVEKSYECSVPDSDSHAWVKFIWMITDGSGGDDTSAEESAQWDKVRNKIRCNRYCNRSDRSGSESSKSAGDTAGRSVVTGGNHWF